MNTTLQLERQMLLKTLADRRQSLLSAADGLTDEQARMAPTVSEFTIGGVIKHVSATEQAWIDFILDIRHDLAPAPWVEPGSSMSAREVLAHLIGETAQHAGHADIIRETIDGKKSMG